MHQSQSVGLETKLKVFLNMTTYANTLPLPGDIFCTFLDTLVGAIRGKTYYKNLLGLLQKHFLQ